MNADISTEMVSEIVESIFATMMDFEVSTVDAPWHPIGDRMTASVFIEGCWNGAVSVECDRSQACQFAGRFLSIDPPDTVDDDVRDVLGEIANMIGGNVKSVIAADARLSMPSVIDGSNYELRVCGSWVQDKVAFDFGGSTFWVTVLSKDPQASLASSAGDLTQRVM